LLSCATVVLGLALRGLLAPHVLVNRGIAATFMSSPSDWGRNVANIMLGLPVMVGYAAEWSTLFTLSGAWSVTRIAFLGAAAATVVLAVPFAGKVADPECRFAARFAGALLALTFAVLAVGQLAVDFGAIRYLLPSAVLCLAAFMTLLWRRWGAGSPRMIAVAALFVLIFCGGAVPFVSRWPGGAASSECDARAQICNLRAALVRNGLHKGYASYWNANVTTLASNGRVVTCGIYLQPRIQARRALVAKECFDRPTDARYFVAFTKDEIAQARREVVAADIGQPDQIVVDGDFEIWIYETARASLAWLER
jgi:hypothetical protein